MKKLDTNEFIRRAVKHHGDTYSYETSVYQGMRNKIEITCHTHGVFRQIADNHIRGMGCPTCNDRRHNTKDFVSSAAEVHGSLYDYSSVVYVNSYTPVSIKCGTHGVFQQKPEVHLGGSHCPACVGKKKMNNSEFVERANRVHNGRYSYHECEFKNYKTPVLIKCRIHGSFTQRADSHLSGAGCPSCGAQCKSLTWDEVLLKAFDTHGARYKYDQNAYLLNTTMLKITCSSHGVFWQNTSSHLNGSNCPRCLKNFKKDTKSFISSAKSVHGGKWDYSSVVYLSSKETVVIKCPTHGDFKQKAGDHLSGNGCPACAVKGFNLSKEAYLYILIDAETYSRVKIGISNVPDKRLNTLKRETPFSIERIDLFETPPEITLQIEKFCHAQLDSANLQGFDGATEWFKFDGGRLEALREFIKSCGGVVP